MAGKSKLLDQWGRPVDRTKLTEEVAAPTFGGVRSPISGYPADGLNPLRLASILREADAGDPVRYLELAETIEERDLHYLGVLGTRKRSVSQVDITVEAGDESAEAERQAKMVRDWLDRDELQGEIFDILDAIGKGYSFTEIVWDFSEKQYRPERLERRDPRWFRFARHDLNTPMTLSESGQEEPLQGFKYIYAQMKAKSGLPIRSGIARAVAWGWMFKAFTQRDWAIFTQTYGQPLRVGKFGSGASKADRDTLFRAVANIAGDCAAIIPESMQVEFVETGNLGSSTEHYERRSDWLDKQVSKAVLGQTATTDAETGGLGSGTEHREVQEDIERADCKQLAAILNRDLIRPWIMLEHGQQPVYPKIKIARPEPEDLAAFAAAVAPLVQVGLKIKQSEVREKFGLSAPDEGDEILSAGVQAPNAPPEGGEKGRGSGVKYPFNTHERNFRGKPALQAEEPPEGRSAPRSEVALLTDQMAREANGGMRALLDQVEAMLEASGSLEEFRENLLSGFGEIDEGQLAQAMERGLLAAHLGGRAMVEAQGDEQD